MFEQFVGELLPGHVAIEKCLFGIIAVCTRQVTSCPYRFEHDIERSGKRSTCSHLCTICSAVRPARASKATGYVPAASDAQTRRLSRGIFRPNRSTRLYLLSSYRVRAEPFFFTLTTFQSPRRAAVACRGTPSTTAGHRYPAYRLASTATSRYHRAVQADIPWHRPQRPV